MGRANKREEKLRRDEREFQDLLVVCLRECAAGRWGLFGHNNHVDCGRWSRWTEAERLGQLAAGIQSMRSAFGQPNSLVERFLEIRQQRNSNLPGEPRLAASLLEEIERTLAHTSPR
jgi:hypothetical protein